MKFIDKSLENYCRDMSSKPPEYLMELDRETHLKVLSPNMLSGYLQGRMLSMISKLVRPSKVVEIGTYTGYSALCFAEGLADNGEVHTIEVNDELEPMIRKYFEKSPFANAIHLHIGDATKVISNLPAPFDLVFIDAGKKDYPLYFDLVIDKLSKGGVILADNVLWSGKVLQEERDDDTEALVLFNEKVRKDPRVEVVMLPVRDGISVIRKK
ncbi:MAG: O-methyltransferase [Saprospirales bacterium]|nr:MAG: O-methyltransferase [Saprospirales bacterium]